MVTCFRVDLVHSFIHSCTPSIHSFIPPSIHLFIPLFIPPFLHSFVPFLPPSIHSFIHSFIHSSIQSSNQSVRPSRRHFFLSNFYISAYHRVPAAHILGLLHIYLALYHHGGIRPSSHLFT